MRLFDSGSRLRLSAANRCWGSSAGDLGWGSGLRISVEDLGQKAFRLGILAEGWGSRPRISAEDPGPEDLG